MRLCVAVGCCLVHPFCWPDLLWPAGTQRLVFPSFSLVKSCSIWTGPLWLICVWYVCPFYLLVHVVFDCGLGVVRLVFSFNFEFLDPHRVICHFDPIPESIGYILNSFLCSWPKNWWWLNGKWGLRWINVYGSSSILSFQILNEFQSLFSTLILFLSRLVTFWIAFYAVCPRIDVDWMENGVCVELTFTRHLRFWVFRSWMSFSCYFPFLFYSWVDWLNFE